MSKISEKIKLHQIMTFIILIVVTIILSGILSAFGVETTYKKVNSVTGSYDQILVTVESLFSLSGLKYIFSSTVANFASFTPLSMLVIVLIGIGIMEKSGFLKTSFTALTQRASKKNITFFLVLIMIVSILILSFVITAITERISIYSIAKYEFKDDKKEFKMGRREVRGLLFALFAGILYLLIFIYNIIPGLPLSGNLLDYSQKLYIDKLFSYNSFFSQGFVFIITILFVILGLFYGMGARTIKNNYDFCDDLGHSLDDIGKTIVIIFMASVFINVFKKTNIGVVAVSLLTNLITISGFKGIPLIVLLFITTSLSTLLLPTTISKWPIMAGTVVPLLMNSGISPEMSQIIFRFGECATYGLTPVMAYFVIYLAFLEKYNQDAEPITLFRTIKYQIPYGIITGAVLLCILIIWYIVGLPLGIATIPTI